MSNLIRRVLELGPHMVVDEVYWVATAMNAIGDFGKLGVQVVTIDQDIFGGDIVRAGFIKRVRRSLPGY